MGLCIPVRPRRGDKGYETPELWGCLGTELHGPVEEALKGLEGVEWVDIDFRRAVIDGGRVWSGDVCLSALDHYIWYCEVDRRPGSYHQVVLQLMARTVKVHPDPWRWARAVDKVTAHAELRSRGFPVPDFLCVDPRHLSRALAALEVWGAVLLKPRRGAWGEGTTLIDHPATLRDVAGYMSSLGIADADGGLLVERYIDNDPERWASVTVLNQRPTIGYRKRAEKIVELPGGRRKVYDANHLGGGVDPAPLSPIHLDLATRASQALDIPFLGFDMIWTAQGPVIVDENTSPGNYLDLYEHAGLEVGQCFTEAISRLVGIAKPDRPDRQATQEER